MSGLEKITARLNSDCEEECRRIITDAQSKADKIMKDAAEQQKAKTEEILCSAKKQAENILSLAESAAAMKEKQNILQAKVNMLNAVLKDALSTLENLDDAEYWETIKKLIADNALKGSGVLIISEGDSKTIPENFLTEVNKKISEKGSLTLSVDDKLTKKGVILVYGDIDINLTFEAVIYSNEDELKRTAQTILFES